MKNKAKNALVKVKNNVKKHKVSYALGAVAIAAIALQQRNLKSFNEFLTEKGIDPLEFYNPEFHAELNNK